MVLRFENSWGGWQALATREAGDVICAETPERTLGICQRDYDQRVSCVQQRVHVYSQQSPHPHRRCKRDASSANCQLFLIFAPRGKRGPGREGQQEQQRACAISKSSTSRNHSRHQAYDSDMLPCVLQVFRCISTPPRSPNSRAGFGTRGRVPAPAPRLRRASPTSPTLH